MAQIKNMSLTDAVGYLRTKGINVSFGGFGDLDGFKDYYFAHYQKALQNLRGDDINPSPDCLMVGFLKDDLEKILE